MSAQLGRLQKKITACKACPRLVQWREKTAREKRASFLDWNYWGKAVPAFGDPKARIVLVGLAPAAHGANRTGRMFTGDRSGDWLYAALHRAGLASQAESRDAEDGLKLKGAWITAMVRCAPPDNKPSNQERDQCLPWFLKELPLLKNAKVLVCLGGFAWAGALRALDSMGHSIKPKPKFGHGSEAEVGPYRLLGSYHPSQQNTFTGQLTRPMLDSIFQRAKKLAD